MHYVQPDLPYDEAALEPAISAKTVHFHYGVHEKAYIDNLNKLIEGTPFADEDLEEIIRTADGAILNNAAQAWNHIFYFFSLNPDGGGEPDGELRKAIDRDFGSFEKFKEDFVDAGVRLFGSGWVWLSKDQDGHLLITKEPNAGNPMRHGLTPILCFDVWEHAYYLDYQNRRADALRALWQLVDWDMVCTRY
ncbi:MAG: superoxide dismutase [Muribaculaceae bacterium]|nr:superoxide dismutase [Muribaculaceae bacterium]